MSLAICDTPASVNDAKAVVYRSGMKVEAVLKQVENDWELLGQLIEIFGESAPSLLEEIRRGIAEKDHEKVSRSAHSLRGAARNFHASAVEQPALELEQIAASGSLRDAESLMFSLAAEVAQLQSDLQALLGTRNAL